MQANKVNLQHIESRPDKIDLSRYEFIVEIKAGGGDFKRSCTALREFTTDLQILTRQRNRTTSSGSYAEGIIVCHSVLPALSIIVIFVYLFHVIRSLCLSGVSRYRAWFLTGY